MWRRIKQMSLSFWQGTCRAFSECWASSAHRFRICGLANCAKLASDRADLSASSQMIFLETTRTASGVVGVIVRSPFVAARWLATAPWRFWYFLRTRTRKQKAILCLVAVLFVTAVVWPMWIIWRTREDNKIWRTINQRLEVAFFLSDIEGVKNDLNALHQARPNDRVVTAQLAALEAGAADPKDPKMARLLMITHFLQGRADASVREAKKHIAFAPKDWTSLIILAQQALSAGDRAQASQWIAQLPSSFDANERIGMWVCSIAAAIFMELGDEARLDDLTEYVTKHWIPHMPKGIVLESDVTSRFYLFQMYLLALRHVAARPDLLDYWSDAEKMIDSILAQKDVSVGALLRFGLALENQRDQHLRAIEQLNQRSAKQTAVWGKALDRAPEHSLEASARTRSKEPICLHRPGHAIEPRGRLSGCSRTSG